MSSKAEVTFTCGALIYGGEGMRPDFPCGNAVTVSLFTTGPARTSFDTPKDWHIKLGSTIVRCPDHCNWVVKEFEVNFDGWGNPCPPRMVKEGHWEDSP